MRVSVSITCGGVFRAIGPNAEDLAPRSEKARALLVLLATAPEGERRRAWLQDKLWSESSPERGAQSLRQALSDIRKSFGSYTYLVEGDRRRVRLLDFKLIGSDEGNFLECLDIADPEFEDWVLRKRARASNDFYSSEPGPPRKEMPSAHESGVWLISVLGTPNPDPAAEFLRRTLADRICHSIGETAPVKCVDGNVPSAKLSLEVESVVTSQTTSYRVTWRKGSNGHRLWSNMRVVGSSENADVHLTDILKLANDAFQGLCEERRQSALLNRAGRSADVLVHEAISKIFSMRASNSTEADKLLTGAFELQPLGNILAWRSMLRMIQIIERHDVDYDVVQEEAVAFSRKALEHSPLNSTVQALAANVLLLIGDAREASVSLAESSVMSNPANPLAWDALSTVAIHHGDIEKGHMYALKAQKIGGNGVLKHWLDMACCLTSVTRHDINLAMAFARSSHALAPDFRPPLRYQLALNAKLGAWEEAEKCRDKLLRCEPEFSVEQMMEDKNYPMAAFRASGLGMSELDYLR